MRLIAIVLIVFTLTACEFRQLLPMQAPPDGTLLRCSKAEAQASGSVVAAGGRVDTCQCIQAGPGLDAEMTIKLPGCEMTVHARGQQ